MKEDISEMLGALRGSKEFFDRSTRTLEESDSNFAPKPGMMTVAQQVAHVARSIEWFLVGAFRPEGFSMDFATEAARLSEVTSLRAARAELERAFADVMEAITARSVSEWNMPLAQGPIMGGAPRWHILPSIVEHTAHHRGVLSVYARLCGKIPPMPYMDV